MLYNDFISVFFKQINKNNTDERVIDNNKNNKTSMSLSPK